MEKSTWTESSNFSANTVHRGVLGTKLWAPAGLEGGVVARGVSLVDAGTVLNVIGDQDHRAAEGAHLGILCIHLEGRRFRSYFSKPVAYMEPALIVIVEKLHIWTSSMICSLTPVQGFCAPF